MNHPQLSLSFKNSIISLFDSLLLFSQRLFLDEVYTVNRRLVSDAFVLGLKGFVKHSFRVGGIWNFT